MKQSDLNVEQHKLQELVYEVQEEEELVNVKLKDQNWVSLSVDNKEIRKYRARGPLLKLFLSQGLYSIRTDGIIAGVSTAGTKPTQRPVNEVEGFPFATLQLLPDAEDKHAVDGISEIAADGESVCTISVEKIGPDGELLTGKEHQDTVYLRSTGGTLLDAKEDERVRSLDLSAGRGAFRVRSENQPKVVTISVLGKPPIRGKAELQIEFV